MGNAQVEYDARNSKLQDQEGYIKGMKNGKAAGPEGIPAGTLLHVAEMLFLVREVVGYGENTYRLKRVTHHKVAKEREPL